MHKLTLTAAGLALALSATEANAWSLTGFFSSVISGVTGGRCCSYDSTAPTIAPDSGSGFASINRLPYSTKTAVEAARLANAKGAKNVINVRFGYNSSGQKVINSVYINNRAYNGGNALASLYPYALQLERTSDGNWHYGDPPPCNHSTTSC